MSEIRRGRGSESSLRDDTLESLTVEEFLLELIEGLSRSNEGFGTLSVSSTERSGDEIGDTSRVVGEGCRGSRGEELEGEGRHFEETNSDDRSFCVSSLF